MAAFVRSAPLPEFAGDSSLVDDAEFYDNVHSSLGTIKKVLIGIPETHKSCINTETLQLNATQGTFVLMAEKIGIPSPPVLNLSENLETSLERMSVGIQLHHALLKSVQVRLKNQETVTELIADTSDLLHHIQTMLKMIQGESVVQPTTAPLLDLQIPGEYDVQVAIHVTLQQLQSFGKDAYRILRRLSPADEEEAES